MRRYLMALLFLSVSFLRPLFSQWSTDPTQPLTVGYGLNSELASDSAGGVYITYEKNLNYPSQLALERLDRYGYKPWGTSKQLTGLLPDQSAAKLTEDGYSGVIVSYHDVLATGSPDNPVLTMQLRVQRANSNGDFLWGTNGVRATLSETNQANQQIVSDGKGGCIVVWTEPSTIVGQRIDSMGNRVWGDTGIRLVSPTQDNPSLIGTDNSSEFLLAYGNQLLKFDLMGTMLWGDGIMIPTGIAIMRPSGEGPVYLLGGQFLGYRSGKLLYTLSLQKIDANGVLQWDSTGVVIDTLNTNDHIEYALVTQQPNLAVAWPHYTDSSWDLRVQLLRNDGTSYLPMGGYAPSKVPSQKIVQGLVPSYLPFTFCIWYDYRTPGGTYAQKLDTLGHQLWDSSDIAVSLPPLSDTKVTTDGNGGFIIVGSGESFSVRAQQVSRNGVLGEILTDVNENSGVSAHKSFVLHQNYPNPFNPTTTITYDLPAPSQISLEMYNQLGQRLEVLSEGFQSIGTHRVIFNSSKVPSGVYYYRLSTNRTSQVRKLTILR